MNLSDFINISAGDIDPRMRQDPRRLRNFRGNSGEWDPAVVTGATGGWDRNAPPDPAPLASQQTYAGAGLSPEELAAAFQSMRIPGSDSDPWAGNIQRVAEPRAGIGATRSWDQPAPVQPAGATGEWSQGPSQPQPQPQPQITQSSLQPSAFKKVEWNPIDNPKDSVPSGTGMLRNDRTRATYTLPTPSAVTPSAVTLDYSRPVEVYGQGKGFYFKDDPMAAMVNGKRIDFGRDTEKERKLNESAIKMNEGRQKLREGEVDIALKQQKLLAKPKAPPNYRWTDEGNLERIPGGAADEKVVNAFNKDTMGVQTTTSSLDNLINTANQVVSHPGLAGNYGVRGVIPNFPGMEAADAKALIARLKDTAGMGALTDLKAAGTNGSSGLGQVTEFEHKILQNQLANLDKAQSLEQVKREIANLVKVTEASKARISNHYQRVYGKMLSDSEINPSPVAEPTTSTPAPYSSSSFDTLPDASIMEGKVIKDTHTGQRLKASGGQWRPV